MKLTQKIRKVFLSDVRAIHELKSWPDEFEAINRGIKTHEVRKWDRDYEVGDLLILREYEPIERHYTGRMLHCKVTHVTQGGRFGLPEDVCVMSVK